METNPKFHEVYSYIHWTQCDDEALKAKAIAAFDKLAAVDINAARFLIELGYNNGYADCTDEHNESK